MATFRWITIGFWWCEKKKSSSANSIGGDIDYTLLWIGDELIVSITNSIPYNLKTTH